MTRHKLTHYIIGALCVCCSSTVMALANPSSVFCAEQGWLGLAGYSDTGVSSYCLLPDGRYIEEWDLFYGSKQRYKEIINTYGGKNTLDVLKAQHTTNVHTRLGRQIREDWVSRQSQTTLEQEPYKLYQLMKEMSLSIDFCERNGWISVELKDEEATGKWRAVHGYDYCLLPNGRYYEGWDLYLGRKHEYAKLIEQCKGKSSQAYVKEQRAITERTDH